MAIDQVTSLPVALAEPATEQAGVIRVAGGRVRHEVRTGTGRGALLSAEGIVRVSHEAVRLEQRVGSHWQAVGSYRSAAVQSGRSVREVGEAGLAQASVSYESQEGEGLKVRLEVGAQTAGSYRLVWSLRGLRGEASPAGTGLQVGPAEDGLWVDWADVVAQGQPVVAEVDPGQAQIIFGPFSLGAGERVVLDPQIWGSENLYPDYYTGAGRRLARTSDGTLCAVYAKLVGGVSHVFFQDSIDGGATWDHEQQLSEGVTANQYPAIAVDSKDDLHIVYQGSVSFRIL